MAAHEGIRRLILEKLQAGETPTSISKQLNCTRAKVYRVKTLFEAFGDVKARHGGGRSRTKRTKPTIAAVQARIKRNLRRTRSLARDFKMDPKTMRNLLSKDLKMKNRAVVPRHFISSKQKELRVTRSRRILSWLKSNSGLVTVFSDEKLFYVDPAHNCRNDRYLASGPVEDVPENIRIAQKNKNPAKVMVLGVLASDGRICPPIFIDSGLKITAAVYLDLLKLKVLPWLKKEYPEGNYCFQQCLLFKI